MARILVTGSSDGLGLLVAQKLVSNGHSVVLHARNASRAQDATSACPGAEAVVVGDISSLSETKKLAGDVNALGGSFDCIVHNAGLYRGGFRRTEDGVPALAAVNIIAPYVLTSLINRPKRLVFLSSSMHRSGHGDVKDVLWEGRGEGAWNDTTAYCDSKLHNIMFAKAFARRWPEVKSNAMDPGWVQTKMGGKSATDDISAAVETYVMLAEGKTGDANKTGRYFRPGKKGETPIAAADDEQAQERLLKICAEFSGVHVQ